ncbi:AfsR/SARP family transcriptional regulator [Micromonospora sonneratiae]|uniref:BTAD domain-containing putative transcriptional regulator n=1 Tax=Micromonospora sonneratiae TaxID=1184706 RepID=A0ABW3YLS3_9ACTN
MRFQLLGQLQVTVDDVPVPLGPPKQQILLAVLLLGRTRLVSTERINDALWDSVPPATARAQVHSYVAALRNLLRDAGGDRGMLRSGPSGYLLDTAPGSVDLDVFDDRVRCARQLLADGRPDEAGTLLREAMGLWRGPALVGLQTRFARTAAADLDQRRLAGAELLVDAYLAARREAEIIPELAELVAAQPLHEGLRHRLMLALHRAGRSAESLQAYREWWRLANDELGIEPGTKLRELEGIILRGEQPQPMPREVATPVPRFQLPADVPAFVGRDREKREVLRLLRANRDHPAVILVTGPAGSGKTALAVHLGWSAREHYPDGQLYLDLRRPRGAAVPAAEALGTLLRGLGLPGATIPAEEGERRAVFRSVLGDRRVLIVLDDAVSAAQVRPLLPPHPGCAVLVTSRSAATGLDGIRLRLAPLTGDEALELLANSAGAQRVAEDRRSAYRIVRRCGYLPLAVRIAGARLAGNPNRRLADLAEALRDQRRRLDELAVPDLAVRAALASTDQLLSDPARRAYHLLGALLPGHDVAGWVVAALLDTTPRQAERVVDELVEVHLLTPVRRPGDEARYRLHDLVRIYGREQALLRQPDSERQAAAERLRDAYLDLAQRADKALGGGFLGRALRATPAWSLPESLVRRLVADPVAWFEAERQPLNTVVIRAAAAGAARTSACLATAAATFYEIRNYFDDWRSGHERALAAAEATGDAPAAMAMLRNLGELHTIQDRYDVAVDCFAVALRYAERLGIPEYEAAASSGLGYVYRLTGRYEEALACFTRARELCRRTGNPHGEAYATHGIGIVYLDQRQWEQARREFAACLTHSRTAGYLAGEAQALRCLGLAHRNEGRLVSAERYFRRAHAVSVRLGDRLIEMYALQWLADVRIRRGEPDEGAELLHRCLKVFREYGQRFGEASALRSLASAAIATGDVGQARHHLTQARRIWEQIGSPYWLDDTLAALAELDPRAPAPAGSRHTGSSGPSGDGPDDEG